MTIKEQWATPSHLKANNNYYGYMDKYHPAKMSDPPSLVRPALARSVMTSVFQNSYWHTYSGETEYYKRFWELTNYFNSEIRGWGCRPLILVADEAKIPYGYNGLTTFLDLRSRHVDYVIEKHNCFMMVDPDSYSDAFWETLGNISAYKERRLWKDLCLIKGTAMHWVPDEFVKARGKSISNGWEF